MVRIHTALRVRGVRLANMDVSGGVSPSEDGLSTPSDEQSVMEEELW